jgi:hypothetical protein
MDHLDHHKYGLARFFANVYQYLGIGLCITGLTAWATANTSLFYIIFHNQTNAFILIAAAMLSIRYATYNMLNMSIQAAHLWFLAITMIEGVFISYVFRLYTNESVAIAFFVSAFILIVSSQYGKNTNSDLTSGLRLAYTILLGFCMLNLITLGLYLLGAFGVNAPTLRFTSWLVSLAIVVLAPITISGFSQQLTMIYNQNQSQNTAILGALILFLEFINLFVSLLRLFGSRRND